MGTVQAKVSDNVIAEFKLNVNIQMFTWINYNHGDGTCEMIV